MEKVKLEGQEYDVSSLSDEGKSTLMALKFTNGRITELTNMHALLQRAKFSYIDSLKKEMLSAKAGFLIDDN